MRNKRVRPWLQLMLSVAVAGGIVFGTSRSFGPLPALGEAFNAGTGVWTNAADDQLLPRNESLAIPGLEEKVEILFEINGTPHIKADTDHDAWLAIGYLHAKFRLFQMDMMRRQGKGLLSEVVGRDALESDRFQRQIDLRRTAEAEWADLDPKSELHQVITSYTEGINAVIAERKESGQWPLMVTMLGYEPSPWEPQDTFVLKGVLAQMMSLSPTPVYNEILAQSLGDDRFEELFPVLLPGKQSPYDSGPYKKDELKPMAISAEPYFQERGESSISRDNSDQAIQSSIEKGGGVFAYAKRLDNLLPHSLHSNSNSNAWVVDGSRTESGKPMLASDPHLELSLPSTWYQIEVEAPSVKFAGVTVPGIPFALVGHNQYISWGMTSGQSQQTFYYKEQTDSAHPEQYYWNGQWRRMNSKTHYIPIKGEKPETFIVKSTIHGPIVSEGGQTLAMTWIGMIPSTGGLNSMMQLNKAENVGQFKEAFQEWTAPAMNFVYADRTGEIAILGAGCYPVFAEGVKPWLVMPGTGEADIKGAIPFRDIPQAYSADSHILASANQRQVRGEYPYYIGANDFEVGYRANRIYQLLNESQKLNAEDFARFQNDLYDPLAAEMVPVLIVALRDASLNDKEAKAMESLRNWNYQMEGESVPASVWWMFWEKYLQATFSPWWEAYKVPDKEYRWLKVTQNRPTLVSNLHDWTLNDPENEFFSNPLTGEKRVAGQVMTEAFHSAVMELEKMMGAEVSKWTWQTIHKRSLVSLSQLDALSYGPRGAGGNSYTLHVAPGLDSEYGPTWRMVFDWGSSQGMCNYPGGQSENPVSPWYQDRVEAWWNGEYSKMSDFETVSSGDFSARWTLQSK